MASSANSSTQNPPSKIPRTDYIDISSDEISPIQNHSTNTTQPLLPPNITLDTTLALSIPPPSTNQTPPTQEAMVSPLALRVLVFSTPPCSPLDPHPYLSSIHDLPPRSSNPLPQTLSQGLTQTLLLPTPMDFEPSFRPINFSSAIISSTMSREELKLNKVYIPKISREKHIPVHLKSIIRDLENISIHEGRTMHPGFAQHSNLKTKFFDIHLQCLYDVDKDIYLRFLLELFSSAKILRDEERGDCAYSNEYSLESLNKNPEEVYPYQTNILTPDEIISDITINGVTKDPLKIRKNELRRDFRFWNEVIESNGIGEET
ncbi:hypothetical protein Tco_0911025 [Tanacetum coccineum]|uniref:Uncharacterized protein n=1 Tax=Tanacetum coccineum TaxID=301880 RepID=A0ABQ5CUL3_9ASTR